MPVGQERRSRPGPAALRPPYLTGSAPAAVPDRSDQAPEGEALILMSTPAGRLSLFRASMVLLVG